MAEVGAVTVSMRVMSAGDGYKYLLRTVAAGDGKRSLSTPLTRYYTAEGTPPGRWMGGGLQGLGGGLVVEGDVVSEAQLQLLIGLGRDPVTGEALGRAYPIYGTAAGGVSVGRGEGGLEAGPTVRASAAAASTGDQSGAGRRRAVAGYDFTFSIPKSASILWGIADARVQAPMRRLPRCWPTWSGRSRRRGPGQRRRAVPLRRSM
jgi:hypothetical protein